MAKQPAIKDDRMYKVDLLKSIRVGRATVNPGAMTRLRGDQLKLVIAADDNAVAGFELAPEIV